MTRRRRQQAEEGVPGGNWLTTYSDMVTLLLCFFVLLFSFSSVDATKFRQVALSLQAALRGVLTGGTSLGPHDLLDPTRNTDEWRELHEAYEEIEAYLRAAGLDASVEMVYEERGIVIRFRDTVLFDLARADLKPDAKEILSRIAVVLGRLPNQIAVEGHTDDLPINTREFPSNWWLATARANRVVEFLIKQHDITPARLSAVGYGEYRPLVPNDSVAGRARNRRVEIVIKRASVGAFEPR